MKLKALSLFLAFVLTLACLAGCGNTTTPPEASAAPTSTPSPEATEPPAEPSATPDPVKEERFARYLVAYQKHDPDDVVMTVDGQEILWSDYFSWIYNAADDLESNYNIEDLTAEPAYASYLTYYAAENCIQVATIFNKAAELGVDLTAEQLAKLESTTEQYKDYFGGEDGFLDYMTSVFLTPEYFRTQTQAVLLYNSLYEHQFGTDGEKLPDEDALQYLEDQGYMHAKHILFSTLDDNRQPLDEETVAEKKALAESVLAQLRACSAAELPTRFDSLMQQYNEDPGMLSYPDGYYFQSGEMVEPFETAAGALEVNQLSELVETDYGYHILFRPASSPEHTMGFDSNYQPYTVRSYAATSLFSNTAYNWYEDAEVVYAPEFEDIDISALMAE